MSSEKILSGDQDGKLIISNINNGQTLKTINAHSGSIWRLSKFSKNKIISCSKDKTIYISMGYQYRYLFKNFRSSFKCCLRFRSFNVIKSIKNINFILKIKFY